jgi:alkane 1-monooxygenase
MPITAHATIFLLPVLAAVGLWLGGAWSWALPVFVFGFIPTAELVFHGSTGNHDAAEEQARRDTRLYDWLIYAIVPVQVALVLGLVWRAQTLTGWDLVGATISVGLLCGGLGINVGHELGHRSDATARNLSKVMLLTTLYMHFFIEHNRGHHRRVATADDPATSRQGDVVYAFWFRSVTGGFRSAWALESERLARRGLGWASWHNEMVRYMAIQFSAVAAVLLIFGAKALAAWLVASVIGILLLETVNYLEHYGLQRDVLPDGRSERVRPAHSWNSNHPLGRVLLFELTRHSDHHAHPARPYPLLRHFGAAPTLPTGYPGMILLSLVPPVFHRVMDRQLALESARLASLGA